MIQSAAKTPSLTTSASTTPSFNRDLFRQASVLIGCVALFAIFSILTSSFYQPSNVIDIMLQSSINAVIAVGMTLVIITRGIDLSVGSIVGLSSMVASDLMSHNIALGIAAGLLVGMICGLVNGLLIAKLKLPDFIVTLGTLSVFRGVALIYTNGQPIYGLPEGFRAAFGGQLLGVPTPVIMAIVVAGLAFFLSASPRLASRLSQSAATRKRRGFQASTSIASKSSSTHCLACFRASQDSCSSPGSAPPNPLAETALSCRRSEPPSSEARVCLAALEIHSAL